MLLGEAADQALQGSVEVDAALQPSVLAAGTTSADARLPIASVKQQLLEACQQQPEIVEWWQARQWTDVAQAIVRRATVRMDKRHLANYLQENVRTFDQVLYEAGVLTADTVERARHLLQQGLHLLSIEPIRREWRQWHPSSIAASLARYAPPGVNLADLAHTIADNKGYLEKCFPILTGWFKCCACSACMESKNMDTNTFNVLPPMSRRSHRN